MNREKNVPKIDTVSKKAKTPGAVGKTPCSRHYPPNIL
jgi:hypothetical protein